MFLTPGIVQAASVPNSDVAVLCFFAWGMRLCLRLADERGGGWNALAAGLCLGLAVGSKYHGLLLVFLFLTVWFLVDGRRFLHLPGRVAALLGTIVAVGSPFYVLNWIHTGNPVWPLFADQLGDGGLLNRVASGYRMPPRFDLTLLTDQLRQPFNANPLVLCLVPLSWPLLPRSRRLRVLAVTAIAYLVSLVLLTSYHRFHLMAWPPLTVLALAGAAASRGTVWRRRLAMTFLVGSVAFGTSFAGWYSWDFLRWAAGLTRSEEIRELSFYYPDYRWMNQNLEASTDVALVCVRSGHTYYLDVPYVRADPGLAATVDWSDVHAEGPAVLLEFLQKRGVTHIFIDEQLDLRVTEAMERLRELGSVELLWRRGRKLLTQRMLRRTLSTTVALYRVLPDGSPGFGTHQR
jgi:4-amino-4-deoxy-L-arabinose transferase-like glycosyltransferase